MKTKTRRILIGLLLAAAIASFAAAIQFVAYARIGTAYAAKIACSAVFLAGRDPAAVASEGDLDLVSIVDWRVDRPARRVTASLGPIRRTAVFREGLGAVLVLGRSEQALRDVSAPAMPGEGVDDPRPWPTGDVLPTDAPPAECDMASLATVLDEAFAEPDPTRLRRTRAVVVVKDGRLIAERYASGFTRHTPLLGWSMTKGVIGALVGILVERGEIRVEDAAGISEWSALGDARGAITIDQLLRMSSGLSFSEEYGPLDEATKMLFGSVDAGKYAATHELEAAPDMRWRYSSGSTNIVSLILRRVMGDDAAYHALPRKALFDRIGMGHAVLETDASGTFVGSSFGWATARDWARFGQLYLDDGVWEGERILPEGWVDYCRRPTGAAPEGCYGAHWWCNAGEPDAVSKRPMERLPPDYYAARGYQGQSVNIFPTQRLVVVRMGLTDDEGAFDVEDFLAKVVRCVTAEQPAGL